MMLVVAKIYIKEKILFYYLFRAILKRLNGRVRASSKFSGLSESWMMLLFAAKYFKVLDFSPKEKIVSTNRRRLQEDDDMVVLELPAGISCPSDVSMVLIFAEIFRGYRFISKRVNRNQPTATDCRRTTMWSFLSYLQLLISARCLHNAYHRWNVSKRKNRNQPSVLGCMRTMLWSCSSYLQIFMSIWRCYLLNTLKYRHFYPEPHRNTETECRRQGVMAA